MCHGWQDFRKDLIGLLHFIIIELPVFLSCFGLKRSRFLEASRNCMWPVRIMLSCLPCGVLVQPHSFKLNVAEKISGCEASSKGLHLGMPMSVTSQMRLKQIKQWRHNTDWSHEILVLKSQPCFSDTLLQHLCPLLGFHILTCPSNMCKKVSTIVLHRKILDLLGFTIVFMRKRFFRSQEKF